MGAVESCLTRDAKNQQSEIERQLESSQRWADTLGHQIDIKNRELVSQSLDIQAERDKNEQLELQISHLNREIEVLKNLLKHSEKEEERLRTELIRAYNALRHSRSNLNKATDQLRCHMTMAMDGEEITKDEHPILCKSTEV